MNGLNFFYGFQFHHQLSSDQEIQSVLSDWMIEIGDFDGFLSLVRNASQGKLYAVRFFIERLKKTGPESTMNLNGGSNEEFTQFLVLQAS